jgi:hypothetical protein
LEIVQPKSALKPGQQLRVIANMEITGGEPNSATAIETEYGLYTSDGRELAKPVRARAPGGQGSRAISMPLRAPTDAGSYVLKVAVYLDGTKAKEATAMLDVAPAPAVQPTVQPQQAAPDLKLIECRTLVRAGRQALTDRNYDTAIANGAEAISVAPQCPGAQQLSIDARKAKQEAQASTIIQ